MNFSYLNDHKLLFPFLFYIVNESLLKSGDLFNDYFRAGTVLNDWSFFTDCM